MRFAHITLAVELLDRPTFNEAVQAFLHKREPQFSGR